MQVVLDEVGLERLYAALEKPLYNVVYRWVWDAHEAQEVVQETFLRLWKMRARVKMETVEPLIYKIGVNLASKRRRKRRLLSWVGLEPDHADPSARAPLGDLMCEERDAAVRHAVESLPEKYRAVILLCEFSDMTYAEVAVALDINPGTVGSRRNTALEKLRAQLEGWRP